MKTIPEQIAELEEKISQTPYHKGTEHQVGRWRARIAKLKHQMWGRQTKKAGGGEGYAVRKSGDATVVLAGPPSVGKSSLLNSLTDARSRVASYDFTTLSVIPGMMKYRGAMIQILDVPGIVEGASTGKGHGREVLSIMRAADLLLIMVEPQKIGLIKRIKKELSEFGIRLDEKPPQMTIKRTTRGGIKIASTVPLHFIAFPTVAEITKEFRFSNAEIVIREDLTETRLIDALMANRVYLPYLVVVNKADLVSGSSQPVKPTMVFISAKNGTNLDQLKAMVWEKLGLMRIFLKPKGGQTDLDEPLIVKQGVDLRVVLGKLNLADQETINRAKVFGPGAKFAGQEVSLNFRPQEGTIISFFG